MLEQEQEEDNPELAQHLKMQAKLWLKQKKEEEEEEEQEEERSKKRRDY